MDSLTPQKPNPEILAALEQIKKWQQEGNTTDAVQGCKEILEIDPTNTEAKNLLEILQKPTITTPTPTTTTTPQPEPAPKKEIENYEITTPENPLYNAITEPNKTTTKTETPKKKTSHGILLNIGIVVGTLAVLTGLAYGYMMFFGNKVPETGTLDLPKENMVIPTDDPIEEDSPTVETSEETTEEDAVTTEKESRNEQRFTDITTIETALKGYFETNGKYPDAMELATLIQLPYDPLDGETDEAGQVFAYSYAVYDTSEGDNQEYILAALTEDESGENTIWTVGADPKDHDDYRDGSGENFIMIMAQTEITSPTETTDESTGPKVKVKR